MARDLDAEERVRYDKVIEIIRRELGDARQQQPRRLPNTYPQLAEQLTGLDGNAIRDWMRTPPRGRPKPFHLPELANALSSGFPDHERAIKRARLNMEFAQALGVVDSTDESIAEIGVAIHDLQARMLRLTTSVAGVAAVGGIPAIVQRVIEKNVQYARETAEHGESTTRPWAFAFWPAVEGPPDGPLFYVGDRVCVATTDGTPITEDDVRADFDSLLGGAALPVRSEWSWPRWVWPDTAPHVSSWIVPRVAGVKEATRLAAWPGVSSVGIVAPTLQSWTNDVASFVADALGYGMTSTELLSGDIFGRVEDEEHYAALDRMQEYLLAKSPDRKVWSHAQPVNPLHDIGRNHLAQDPLHHLNGSGYRIPDGLVVVWLHESDGLLEMDARRLVRSYIEKNPDSALSKEQLSEIVISGLRAARKSGDETAEKFEGHGIYRVDVTLPDLDLALGDEGEIVNTCGSGCFRRPPFRCSRHRLKAVLVG